MARCVWQAPDSNSLSGSCPTFALESYQACCLWGAGASSGTRSQHPCPSFGADRKVGEAVAELLWLLLGQEDLVSCAG